MPKVVGKRVIVLTVIMKRMLANGQKVDVAHLSRIFSGQRNPSVKMLRAMALALGLTMDETWELIEKVRAKQYWTPKLIG